MSEETGGAPNSPPTTEVPIEWAEVDTILVDQVIGFTHVEGIGRITFGRLDFRPNMPTPIGRPVVTLAGSLQALGKIRDQISSVIAFMEEQGRAEIDVTGRFTHG